jgi:outer membrane receptor protein involved in Fe transport
MKIKKFSYFGFLPFFITFGGTLQYTAFFQLRFNYGDLLKTPTVTLKKAISIWGNSNLKPERVNLREKRKK